MKKLILLLFVVTLLTSCEMETRNAEVKSTDIIIEGRTIRVYVIDSCEYVGKINHTESDFISHKGNCQFCEKRREQEIETIKNDF